MTGEEVKELVAAIRKNGTIAVADIARALNVSTATVGRWASGTLSLDDEERTDKLRSLVQEDKVWLLKILPIVLLGWTPGALLEERERLGLQRHWKDYFTSAHIEPAMKDGSVLRCTLELKKDVDFFNLSFMVRAGYENRVTLSYDGTPPGGKTLRFPQKQTVRKPYVTDLITMFLHYAF